MKYGELLALRDQTIRDILLAELQATDQDKEQVGALFDKALQVANRDVEQQLRDLFGKDIDRILKRKYEAEQSTL
jgi:hypothetical protein